MKTICLIICISLVTVDCFATHELNGWKYEYKVGAAGKRSESVYGELSYNGKALPKEYNHVITPLGEFVFIDARGFGSNEKIRWVPFGRLPGYSEGTMAFARTEKDVEQLLTGKIPRFRTTAITEAPLDVSAEPYLEGAFENRPKGVGSNWFCAVKHGLWVNPAKMDKALIKLKLRVQGP